MAFVFHKYAVLPDGAHILMVLPAQQEELPDIDADCKVFIANVLVQMLEHPFAPVTVTV